MSDFSITYETKIQVPVILRDMKLNCLHKLNLVRELFYVNNCILTFYGFTALYISFDEMTISRNIFLTDLEEKPIMKLDPYTLDDLEIVLKPLTGCIVKDEL